MRKPNSKKNYKKDLILVGGGGHCNSCIDVIESSKKYLIRGIIDNNKSSEEKILGYRIIGRDIDYLNQKTKNKNLLISVGQILNYSLRKKLYQKYMEQGALFPKIISASSYVSKSSKINYGTIIMHGAIVNSQSVIGENSIINSRAIIEHDAKIGSHTHISTGVILNGGSEVGSCSFIGSGSIIFENVKIGNNCVIPAGSIIKRDILDNTYLKR